MAAWALDYDARAFAASILQIAELTAPPYDNLADEQVFCRGSIGSTATRSRCASPQGATGTTYQAVAGIACPIDCAA